MTGHEPCIIALYLCVPEDKQLAAAHARFELRRTAARLYDVIRAFARAKPEFRFHAWDSPSSNKGDIAIRECIKAQLRKAFAPRQVSFLEFEWGGLDDQAVHRINERAGLFVIAGSGYFFPVYGKMPDRIDRDSTAIQAITVPKAAYSVGWNTLVGEDAPLDEKGLVALRTIVGELDRFSVRDAQSQARIKAATGVEPCITADPVLFHSGDVSQRRAANLRPKIAVNIACHGSWPASNVKRDITKIARTLKAIKVRYSAELHFISHSSADRIVWWLLFARGVRTKFRCANVSEMPAIYREMDALFGQMMHSTIFAMGAGVPTIAIGYDAKLYGFFSLMGMSEFVVNLTDWDTKEIIGLLDRVMTEGASIRQALADRKRVLEADCVSFLAEVAGLLNRPAA